MTSFSPELAAVRFGYGMGPGAAEVASVRAMLSGISVPLLRQTGAPSPGDRFEQVRALRQSVRSGNLAEEQRIRRVLRALATRDMLWAIQQPLQSPHGFRDRLFAFWADHFTVSAKNRQLGTLIPDFRDHAIGAHIAGRFADMLKAVVTHPAMLIYLDQNVSVGPNAPNADGNGQGLNENLARELLELHTRGVGGDYGQHDVREMAELLTGLRVTPNGFVFRKRLAEPGPEVVLGRSYGGGPARLDDIYAALEDLALHPDTAEHIVRKLAVHFVSPEPDDGLVKALAAEYMTHGGALQPVYEALLNHPVAWSAPLEKVKPPLDFMTSAFRATGLGADDLVALSHRELRKGIVDPLVAMGQDPFRPPGPDGWSEAAEAWISAPTLAARLRWALGLARRLGDEIDPRDMIDAALGSLADPVLRIAVAGSETRWEGVALVLASPAFNRR